MVGNYLKAYEKWCKIGLNVDLISKENIHAIP